MSCTSGTGGTERADRARWAPLVRTSVIGGAAVYLAALLLEFVEPGEAVFFASVLVPPLVVGAIIGARGGRTATAVGIFVVAYLAQTVHDWIVTGGDQLFHLALAVITGALAGLAAGTARRTRRRRHAQVDPIRAEH